MIEVTLFAEPESTLQVSERKLKKGEYFPDSSGLFSITDIGDHIWRISRSWDSDSRIEIIKLGFTRSVTWKILIKNKHLQIYIESDVYDAMRIKGGLDPRSRVLKITFKGDKERIRMLIQELNELAIKPPYEFSNWRKFSKKFGYNKDEIIMGWKEWL